MKEVAVLLLMALLLNGCGSSTPTLQSTTGGIFQAAMYGGVGEASGFSFITQFTLNGDNSLNPSFFQFDTENPCFALNGPMVTGSIANYVVNTDDTVTGTLMFTVTSGGNILKLTGSLTGTATVTGTGSSTSTTLTSASVSGTWSLTGSSGCNATGGSFSMTES
jgi:hypothetical protein